MALSSFFRRRNKIKILRKTLDFPPRIGYIIKVYMWLKGIVLIGEIKCN